jgi:hypothetical protein
MLCRQRGSGADGGRVAVRLLQVRVRRVNLGCVEVVYNMWLCILCGSVVALAFSLLRPPPQNMMLPLARRYEEVDDVKAALDAGASANAGRCLCAFFCGILSALYSNHHFPPFSRRSRPHSSFLRRRQRHGRLCRAGCTPTPRDALP